MFLFVSFAIIHTVSVPEFHVFLSHSVMLFSGEQFSILNMVRFFNFLNDFRFLQFPNRQVGYAKHAYT